MECVRVVRRVPIRWIANVPPARLTMTKVPRLLR